MEHRGGARDSYDFCLGIKGAEMDTEAQAEAEETGAPERPRKCKRCCTLGIKREENEELFVVNRRYEPVGKSIKRLLEERL